MHIIWAILGLVFIFLDYKKSSVLKLTLATSFMFCAIISYKTSNTILSLELLPIFLLVFYALIVAIDKKEKRDIKKENKIKDFINKTAIVKKDIDRRNWIHRIQ